jgi:predicted PurR-regulated permease PerM
VTEPETPSKSPPSLLDPQLTGLLIWIARVVLALLALYVLSLALPVFLWVLGILSPFIVGLVIAYVLDPLVGYFQRRLHLGRVGGLLLLLLMFLVAVLIVLGVVIPIVVTQIYTAGQGVQQFIDEGLPRLLQRLDLGPTSEIYAQITQAVKDWQGAAGEAVSVAGSVVSWSVATVFGTVGFFMTLALVGIIAFYFLLDFHGIWPTVDGFVPVRHRERFWRVWAGIHANLSGFLRGQLIVCLCVGALITVGLLIVGPRQYALLIGLFAGAVNFIPYLGPTAGGTPAVLWALLSPQFDTFGDRAVQVGLILLVFGGTQAFDGFFLSPRIIGSHAQLHPLLVILALLVGAQGGISGMIIAVPLMIILKALFTEFVWRPMNTRREVEESLIR